MPSSLLRTHPPPSRLSAHFVLRLIGLTFAPAISARDEEGFPSCYRSFLPVSPLLPRHRSLIRPPVSMKKCCLGLTCRGSASGTRLLRGYFCVHVSYDPDLCSPAYSGLCRWAPEDSVSTIPCHPRNMASGFYHGGTLTRKKASTLCWARSTLKM